MLAFAAGMYIHIFQDWFANEYMHFQASVEEWSCSGESWFRNWFEPIHRSNQYFDN